MLQTHKTNNSILYVGYVHQYYSADIQQVDWSAVILILKFENSKYLTKYGGVISLDHEVIQVRELVQEARATVLILDVV